MLLQLKNAGKAQTKCKTNYFEDVFEKTKNFRMRFVIFTLLQLFLFLFYKIQHIISWIKKNSKINLIICSVLLQERTVEGGLSFHLFYAYCKRKDALRKTLWTESVSNLCYILQNKESKDSFFLYLTCLLKQIIFIYQHVGIFWSKHGENISFFAVMQQLLCHQKCEKLNLFV